MIFLFPSIFFSPVSVSTLSVSFSPVSVSTLSVSISAVSVSTLSKSSAVSFSILDPEIETSLSLALLDRSSSSTSALNDIK